MDYLKAPYINLCFQPAFKPSMLQNHGLPDNNEIDLKHIADASGDAEKWNLYHNLSYELGKDFVIRIQS